MNIIKVTDNMMTIMLGRRGENEHTQIWFDVSDWMEEYPDAAILLINQLPYSNEEYPVVASQPEDGIVKWTVGGAELNVEGYGQCTLEAVEGNVVAKKHIWRTKILPAMGEPGEAPEAWESWMTEFARMVGEADDAVEDAEAWAIGTDDTEHPAYENSAKEHAEAAGQKTEDAEAWAVGKRGGTDVPDTDETYHNNSKYYAEQSAEAVTEALEDMTFNVETLDPGQDVTVTKEVDPVTGDVSIGFGIPRGLPGNEIQIHRFTFTITGNSGSYNATISANKEWFEPGLPVFTDNARVIGYNVADTSHWKNLTFSIDRRKVSVSGTKLPGATEQTLELYVADTKPKA